MDNNEMLDMDQEMEQDSEQCATGTDEQDNADFEESFEEQPAPVPVEAEPDENSMEIDAPPPDCALIDALRGLYGNDAERVAKEVMRAASKESEERYGVPYEAAEIVAKARVRGGGVVGNMTSDEERVFVRGLMQQESRLREKNPDFDLEATLRVQPTLRVLLASGEPLEKALSYLNIDQRLAEKEVETERRVLSQISARKTRPQPIGRSGTGGPRIDFSRMTDVEMREIDDRLKRGEKVYL